jgi:hypothetical protein
VRQPLIAVLFGGGHVISAERKKVNIMAEGKPKFPVIPASHWWALRDRFKKSIPSVVDAKFIAATLGMSEGSARSNVLPALKTLGIIDDENKTGDLAIKWREDSAYKGFCEAAKKNVYPQTLLDVAPDATDESREAARRWFGGHGVGEGMVAKASQVYALLCEADPTAATKKAPKAANVSSSEVKKTKPAPRRQVAEDSEEVTEHDHAEQAPPLKQNRVSGPAVHLNIQIHISPDVTPEQIDSIFASMAKHLKNLSE